MHARTWHGERLVSLLEASGCIFRGRLPWPYLRTLAARRGVALMELELTGVVHRGLEPSEELKAHVATLLRIDRRLFDLDYLEALPRGRKIDPGASSLLSELARELPVNETSAKPANRLRAMAALRRRARRHAEREESSGNDGV